MHQDGGWSAEAGDTPPTAAKLVAMSQFARKYFKNAENSPDTEFPDPFISAAAFPKPAFETS